jgi:pyruvate formate-lyase activating enzyme-like uncharacterized protein
MRIVPYQEILEEKFKRQRELLTMGAQLHANGHCLHYGRISFGCRDCFTGEQSINLFHGTQCMCHCPYCYYAPAREELVLNEEQEQREIEFAKYKLREFDNYRPAIVSLGSSGETLLYLDTFERYAAEIYSLIYEKNIHPYTFIYTNGILAEDAVLERLQHMGVQEVRFHWSAGGFSDEVYDHMKLAKARGMIVTVEEPAYPPNRDALLERLPALEDLGLDHLDLIELHLTEHNYDAMERLLPGEGYRVYKDYFYHLYDNGMAYDVMETCIRRNYHFSVIDCNSGVERCRNSQDQDVCFSWDSVEGMCRPWKEGPGFVPRMKNGRPYREFQ